MLDVAQLERTLDLWASMWAARERAQFERALERIVEGDAPDPLKAAAVCACHIIGTPRLVGAATNAAWALDRETLAEIGAVAAPRARLLRHAAGLAQDRDGVRFLLHKIVREPWNPVADKLLDRLDIRDLYAVMSTSFDDEVRSEAGRRIARRGPHQRARLLAALDLPPDAFDDQLSVDVPLDDLDFDADADAWLPEVVIELGVSA
jgi:hypothetical protein